MSEATAADVGRWAEEIDRVRVRLGPRFARSEVRHRVGLYLRGLLTGVERKNGWQLAEFAGTCRRPMCSTSSVAPPGTPTPCATTCAPTSSRAWASPTAS